MRILPFVAAALMVGTAADARCLARLSEPLVFVADLCDECDQLLFSLRALKLKPRICNISADADCKDLYEDHRESDTIPLTFVCNQEVAGNKPKAIMDQIAQEKTEINPGDLDYGDWDEKK